MPGSSFQVAGSRASTGTAMYRPRRTRLSHPLDAHADNRRAADSRLTPNAAAAASTVTVRCPAPNNVARSRRPRADNPPGSVLGPMQTS